MKPEDEHADAVARVCSYHRRDFDLVLIPYRPLVTGPVKNSLQTVFESPPTSGLGDLDCLPEELVTMVVKNLDLLSLFRFRRVNRYARILSTALREYQLVAKYALEQLRALLRTGCARSLTIVDLYRLLISDSCELCGHFGGFFFLLTATRFCFTCFQNSVKLHVISTTDFARVAGISTFQLSKSYGSTLKTLAGQYYFDTKGGRRPKKIILKEEAMEALASQGVLDKDSINFLSRCREKTDQRHLAGMPLPWFDTRTGKIDYGVSCKGCEVRFEKARGRGNYYELDMSFSTPGFLSHFESCVEAQEMWAKSEEGTMSLRDSEFVVRGGLLSR